MLDNLFVSLPSRLAHPDVSGYVLEDGVCTFQLLFRLEFTRLANHLEFAITPDDHRQLVFPTIMISITCRGGFSSDWIKTYIICDKNHTPQRQAIANQS